MDTIFIISILLLAVAVFALRRRKRLTPPKEPDFLSEPRRFDGLFAEQHAEEMRLLEQAEAERSVREERRRLLGRAAEGDKTALDDAHTFGDAEFYREILRTLAAHADGDEEALRSIAERIVDSRALRSSGEFAAMIIERLGAAPDRSSLVRALHLAALSDDAAVFKRAVETASNLLGEGRLPQVSAEDFLAAVEGAYWLIDAEVRSSGSGFLLKRLIADVRRGLAAASRRSAS
ncbi:MAG TPA: hypothetical protein VKG02_03005 [Blastocatellia bacterium]|nr:hypothetical protein [Blastocatellia bacterium]